MTLHQMFSLFAFHECLRVLGSYSMRYACVSPPLPRDKGSAGDPYRTPNEGHARPSGSPFCINHEFKLQTGRLTIKQGKLSLLGAQKLPHDIAF